MFIIVFFHRLTCLSTCLDLVKRCCLLYKDLPSFTHIFQPIRTLLSKHLSTQTLPEPLQVSYRFVLIFCCFVSFWGFFYFYFYLNWMNFLCLVTVFVIVIAGA